MKTVLTVHGMTCEGCAGAVNRAITAIAPEAAVTVDLARGRVAIEGQTARAALVRAVRGAGFEVAEDAA